MKTMHNETVAALLLAVLLLLVSLWVPTGCSHGGGSQPATPDTRAIGDTTQIPASRTMIQTRDTTHLSAKQATGR